jgi:hypothetical protein
VFRAAAERMRLAEQSVVSICSGALPVPRFCTGMFGDGGDMRGRGVGIIGR